MGNLATTVNEQIKILRERRLELDYHEKKVKEILLDIGYYRLGFYWNPFEKDSSHNFIKGTKFSDVVYLYYLDSDLRNLFIKYLNRIEINFKTQVIYYVSNRYKHSPTWFADTTIIHSNFIKELPKYYTNDFIKHNKTIKAHHNKYINQKYAPAWKTLEFLPFGSILAIFRSLKDKKAQTIVSEKYGIKNPRIFKEYIKTLLTVRNICAHGGQLFDLNTPKGIPTIPPIFLEPDERHSLYGVVLLMNYFLEKISENRKQEFINSLNRIISKACEKESIKKIIETKSSINAFLFNKM